LTVHKNEIIWIYTDLGIDNGHFLWVVWLLFDVYYGTNIPFFPSSDRNLVYFVVIVITLAVVSYVFYREMRSLNKAIKDIDEFSEKNN